MEQKIAVDLISRGVLRGTRQRWADLGSGDGLFANAVALLLPPGSTVYAIDKENRISGSFSSNPDIRIEKMIGDFTQETVVPFSMDGFVLANSIHYVPDKIKLFGLLMKRLNNQGRIIIIEYDMEKPNPWVPFPLSFKSLTEVTASLGLDAPQKIGQVPSQLNKSDIYSAVISK